MAQNRAPWLRLATQRFDLPARPVPTPAPAATPPQALAPPPAPASPPRAVAPTSVQPKEPATALTPSPTLTLAPAAPTPAPMQSMAPTPPPASATTARAPSPTPALTPVISQPPQRQQTPSPPALRPATPPRTQPPSPSPSQRQAFQPAPPSPQTRTSPPAVALPQASKSQPASPSPPPQLKGSPPRPQPQSPKTAQPSSSTPPSLVLKPGTVPEIVKNQVITKYPTAAMEADSVVQVKNIVPLPPGSHVAVITDSKERNHTPPQHSKINKHGRVDPVKTVPPSRVAGITEPQHSQINGEGNSGPGLHGNHIIPVGDGEPHGMRVIAISGENNGATMEIIAGRRGVHNVANGNEKRKKEAGNNAAAKEGESAKKEPGHRHKLVSAVVNSNVQSVNNSIVYGCNCAHNSPGVHLGLHGKPAVFKPQAAPATIGLGTSTK